MHDGVPRIAAVGRAVDLSARGAKVDAAGVELVHGHGVAQDVDVAISLWEALGEGFPLIAAGTAAVDAELAVERKVFAVALDGDDVDSFRFVGVDVDDEAEIGGE